MKIKISSSLMEAGVSYNKQRRHKAGYFRELLGTNRTLALHWIGTDFRAWCIRASMNRTSTVSFLGSTLRETTGDDIRSVPFPPSCWFQQGDRKLVRPVIGD